MDSIGKAVRNPQQVEYAMFSGWAGIEELIIWAADRNFIAHFVPVGYDHRMRRPEEMDSSRGDVLTGAPAFLVLRNAAKDAISRENRVEVNSVLVYENLEMRIVSLSDFRKDFETVKPIAKRKPAPQPGVGSDLSPSF